MRQNQKSNSKPVNSISLVKICVVAFLIAAEIVLTRFLSINTPIVRVGFGFLPVAITAVLYGPLWAAAAYAAGDILGALLFPTGPYFPGFTLTAFLTGLTYGFFFRKKNVVWKTALPAAAAVCLLLNLGLDTFWLYIIMNQGVFALLPARILKAAIMLPVQTFLIPPVWKALSVRTSVLR
ncbi:MAG: folate family ECF transporter S component [Clostridiales Family XIII bacterium]|jgi:ECF transporter S component (folate family)|nr:folate family ECF transporter S component [Clostridiales Family XIII bacterium]